MAADMRDRPAHETRSVLAMRCRRNRHDAVVARPIPSQRHRAGRLADSFEYDGIGERRIRIAVMLKREMRREAR